MFTLNKASSTMNYQNQSLNGSFGGGKNSLINTTISGTSPPIQDSPLKLFGLAKRKINEIFNGINDYLIECEQFVNSEENLVLLNKNEKLDLGSFVEKVNNIREVLTRDHMKVAFFGRTSNGKSTVINSVLHNNILPFGMGHTTNCFLQIEGIESNEPYYSLDNDPEKKFNIDSIHNLANALNSENLGDDTLCKIYWPKNKCNLLKDDVVLVDSPGIDVSPNLDNWIDKYCMDADVFVLVSNSESTIMLAEKSFFHKVSEKISKPNIFILNNRWDVVASEPESEKVKKQHTERSISFLCNELNVITRSEADERVFFVSAKEVINSRTLGKQANKSEMKEGFQQRYFEFENFENKFEECLSKSAIKTKFDQHTKKGIKIMKNLKKFLEDIDKTSTKLKDEKTQIRKQKYEKLAFIEQRFKLITTEVKNKIKYLSNQAEAKVTAALNEEIRRLPVLLNDFEFSFNSDKLILSNYKNELNTFVENGLTSNMKARLNDTINLCVESYQKEMIESVANLIPSNEKKKQYLFNIQPRSSFEILYKFNCKSVCADFQEDLEFKFSFGILTITSNLLNSKLFKKADSKSLSQTPSNDINSNRKHQNEALVLFSRLIDLNSNSQSTVGALAVGGLMVRTIGIKVLAVTCVLYIILYSYERLTWTNKAKERVFKKQYVRHATTKLSCIVDLTGSNCSHQVQQEISSTFARLCKIIDETINEMKQEIEELDCQIKKLDNCLNKIRILKNKAIFFTTQLDLFSTRYLYEET